jgi:hypothetical protein
VAMGAAKLTKLICNMAKIDSPVRPSGNSSGARRATSQSRMPLASSRRISDSITTITGSRMKKASSTAERPARRMISVRSSMTYLNPGDAMEQGEQPHAQFKYSGRRMDGIERDPEQFFKRYNAKNPERGGA